MNSYLKRPIISSASSNSTFSSNSFSISQTSSLFFPSTSPTPLFSQQPVELFSRFRFAPSSNLFDSPPSQIVPSLSPKPPSSSPITTSKIPQNNEPQPIRQSFSSKIWFTLLIFTIGLILGYFLTNTISPNLIRHWFFILHETSISISVKSIHLLSNYLQIIQQYISYLNSLIYVVFIQ